MLIASFHVTICHFLTAEQEAVARVRMRLFVGNPRDTVLTGVCVCMTRTNPQRSVTEENVHRVSIFMDV